jgi:hypothetical protein
VAQALATDPVNTEGLGHTIGNLAPLSGRKNAKLKNMPFGKEKAKIYLQSRVLMTRQIGDDFDRWRPVEVRTQTEDLVAKACVVWPLSDELW